MGVELLFIQIFMKLIGYPIYTVATVITVMLIAAALGSMCSRAVAGPETTSWFRPFVGLLASGVAVWLFYPALSAHYMAAAPAVRIVAAALMIFPAAFFMGMPFPLGITELRTKPHGSIAWAWSMNGLFTTIGSVSTALLSLSVGFRATLLMALSAYAAAMVAFGALRRSNRQRVHGRESSCGRLASRATLRPPHGVAS